jgi:sigma-B regulation protein RsbU (phosphoserine phosphatase)
MLFFSVLGILVIYLLITYITNKQIEPLTSITSQLKKFSSAGSEITGNSENEIRQVSDSLNILKAWQEKQRLSQDEQQKQSKKRSRDIKQAAEIQQSFIRTDFPAFPERKDVDLYACYRPAKGVSGDLYDYFFIDDEHLVFTIGDVSGKGIPAAFFMSVAQTIIKSCATKISAKEIVMAANTELYTNNQHQFFLTLFLGVLNVKTGSLLYCNAAHTAPYILKSDGSITELAQSHGLPLGLYSDKMYEEAEIQIQKGDIIVLYTDGVNELQDENGIQYGAGRLEENLRNLVGLNPQEVVFKVEKSLDVFLGETKQIDDISILVLSYKA